MKPFNREWIWCQGLLSVYLSTVCWWNLYLRGNQFHAYADISRLLSFSLIISQGTMHYLVLIFRNSSRGQAKLTTVSDIWSLIIKDNERKIMKTNETCWSHVLLISSKYPSVWIVSHGRNTLSKNSSTNHEIFWYCGCFFFCWRNWLLVILFFRLSC